MTVTLRGPHQSSVVHMSLFLFGFERKKCRCASAETSVRRERPVKEEEKEDGSKEDGYQALAAKTITVM